jgi:hypothetical protein
MIKNGIISTEVFIMLKIPRSILQEVGALNSEIASKIPGNFEQSNSSTSGEEIILNTLTDVEWVTNALEPDQQRGPSENP